MDHFVCCKALENAAPLHHWRKMFENDPDDQRQRQRQRQRSKKIEQYEAGHHQLLTDSKAPVYC